MNNYNQDIKVADRIVMLSKLAKEMIIHEGISEELVVEVARKGKAIPMTASGKAKRFMPTSQGVVVVITGKLWGNRPGLCVATVYRTTRRHMESALTAHRKRGGGNHHHHQHQHVDEHHKLVSTLALLRDHKNANIRRGQFQEILRRDPQVLLQNHQVVLDALLSSLSDKAIIVQVQGLRTLCKLVLTPGSLFYNYRDASMLSFNQILLHLSMAKNKDVVHHARTCLELFQVPDAMLTEEEVTPLSD